MKNPLAPERTLYSCAVAAVKAGAMDINGSLIDPSKLSDELLDGMIELSVQDELRNQLIAEKEKRS